MIEPVLLAGAAAIGMVAAMSALKNWLKSRLQRNVTITTAHGKTVTLDLDKRLTPSQVSNLLARAVKSANAGDQAAVTDVENDSHAASEHVRRSTVG